MVLNDRDIEIGPPSSVDLEQTMSAAEKIKTYRTKAGLSQGQFAKLIGATQGLINHWEQNRQQPSPSMARTIEQKTDGDLRRIDLRPDIFS